MNGNITSNPSYNSTGEGAYDGMFHDNGEQNWAIVNSAIMFVGNLAVAEANEVMPPKSTFFYPKYLSGFINAEL